MIGEDGTISGEHSEQRLMAFLAAERLLDPEETKSAEIGPVRILPDPGMASLDKIIAEQDVYYGRTPEAVQQLEARLASHVDTVFEPLRQRYTVSSKSFSEKGMGPDVEAAVKDFLYRNGLRSD